ncbi:MAG: alpha/beta fold hydrolase [Cyclobacteriaceae bacterium]|nr:alpha/beta fold hydrolase [Cyclobacteriaceae bacterium]
MKNQVIHLGERTLQCLKTGSGNTLVIAMPGGPGLTHHYLNGIHEALPPEQYTVLSYSPSGTIGNENAPFYKSIKGYADELNAIIALEGYNKVVLIGHSFSCAVMQEFLIQYPSANALGAVLINSFSSGNMLKQGIEQRIHELPEEFLAKRKTALTQGDGDALDALTAQYWFPSFVIRMTELPTVFLQSLAGFRECAMNYYFNGPDFTNLNGAIVNWDRSGSLHTITCPVLLMSGGYDYISRADTEAYQKQLPNAQLWFHPEVSHFPMLEKPDEFSSALRTFLDALN